MGLQNRAYLQGISRAACCHDLRVIAHVPLRLCGYYIGAKLEGALFLLILSMLSLFSQFAHARLHWHMHICIDRATAA